MKIHQIANTLLIDRVKEKQRAALSHFAATSMQLTRVVRDFKRKTHADT